jgi:hypothetical protein
MSKRLWRSCVLSTVVCMVSSLCALAQETSRTIPFNNLPTSLPPGSMQDVTAQLKDTPGAVLFSEPQNVLVEATGADPAAVPQSRGPPPRRDPPALPGARVATGLGS